MTTSLYRFFDPEGRLLYVGISGVVVIRLHQHAREKGWWTEVVAVMVDHFPTREAARAAELQAIRDEKPKYNVADLVERVQPPRVGMRRHNQGSVFWNKRVDRWIATLPVRMGRRSKSFHSKDSAEAWLATKLEPAA